MEFVVCGKYSFGLSLCVQAELLWPSHIKYFDLFSEFQLWNLINNVCHVGRDHVVQLGEAVTRSKFPSSLWK
jgi:hypothetical protein